MSNLFQTTVTRLPEGLDRDRVLSEFDTNEARRSTVFTDGIVHTPAASDRLGRIVDEFNKAKASEAERARQESLREAQASVRVGGLSVADAERLVNLIRGGAEMGALPEEIVEQIPVDLRESLGIKPDVPEFEAMLRVRFKRSHLPYNTEVQAWVEDAFHFYSDHGNPPCGTDDCEDDWLVEVSCEGVGEF